MSASPPSRALSRQLGIMPEPGPRWVSRTMLASLLGCLQVGRLTVVTPKGDSISSVQTIPGPEAVLILHHWRGLRRLAFGGDVALAEAYIDEDWSSPSIANLIELASLNGDALRRSFSGTLLARMSNRLRHLMRANTKPGSRRNIVAHYDLGNAFYERWLDRGMSYSSALYATGFESLEEAQTAKQDRILAALDLKGGEHVLEIGCGWGGLAERLAERGCRVTGITLSPAQLDYAQSRIERAGLTDRVELRHQDYRDVGGTFDRIVSVEMIEAVGRAYWPTYFSVLRDRLKAGGVAVVQAITIADDRFDFYAATPDFIQRHIFPGGMLPSPDILAKQSNLVGLGCEQALLFGASYARTLMEWRQRFLLAWPDITGSGFDERFRRLWEYYLAYCEGGFRSGAIDVGLYRLALPSGAARG